jgi:hypothetical protein
MTGKRTRNAFLYAIGFVTGCLGLGHAGCSAMAESVDRPNILFIFSDDHAVQ